MSMKINEIRALADDEIKEKISKLREELAKDYALIASGTRPEKPAKIRNAKKDIARMLTVLNERKKNKKVEETK